MEKCNTKVTTVFSWEGAWAEGCTEPAEMTQSLLSALCWSVFFKHSSLPMSYLFRNSSTRLHKIGQMDIGRIL